MSETLKFGAGLWATKEGSTLAYNNENGNFKPLPFNFERAGTATRVNKEGLIEVVSNNEPRIDFSNDSKGALLLEPSRSNLITYSEDFNNNAWTKSGTTLVYPSSIISPDGTLNGTLVEGATDLILGGNNLNDGWGATGGLQYVLTAYVKSKTATKVGLALRENGSGNFSRNEDIPITTNEWKRISVTISSPVSANSLFAYFGGSDGDFYIWGAQLEQGSYPTSYIPTNGSTVTRVAETCTGAGDASTFNDSEGVLFAEFALQEGDNEVRQLSISNGTDNENIKILQLNGSTIRLEVKMSSGPNFVEDVLIAAEINNKFAIQYKANDYKVFVNGFKRVVNQRSTTPTGLSKFNFDRGDGASDFYGNTKQIQYFDKALTDEELQALTS